MSYKWNGWKVAAMVAVASVLGFAVPTKAAGPANDGLVNLKTGSCTFKVFNSDGVKPLAGANVALVSTESSDQVLKATADETGKCVANVATGRYLLKINDENVAVVDSSAAATISECRVIMPAATLVGGAEEKKNKKSMVPIVIGAAVVVAGLGAWAIVDANEDDDDDDETMVASPAATTVPAAVKKSSKKKTTVSK